MTDDRKFARLFDTPDGQLLVTKEFDDDGYPEEPYRLRLRGEGVKGIAASLSFGWDTPKLRQEAFDEFTQGQAEAVAKDLAATLRNFSGFGQGGE